MVEKITESQAAFDMGFENAEEFRMAAERGRQAAAALMMDPIRRAYVESKLGTERCRQRWPEAYKEK